MSGAVIIPYECSSISRFKLKKESEKEFDSDEAMSLNIIRMEQLIAAA